MMEEGRKAHPNEAYYVIGLAQVAQARGDLEAAVNYFAAGRKLAPTAVESYVFAADCLTALGRLDQAEAVARQAMSVAPEDVRGFLSHARVAVKAADLPTALDRWELVIQRFDHQIGYIGAAQILRQLGRLEEAERLVVAATIRFPTDPGPPTELARIAQMRGDNTTSIVLWKKLAHRFPVTLHCLCDAASSLEALEDSSAAESVLRQAVENLPYESRPRVELARLLARRSDFLAAAEAWSELRRSFPDNEEAYVQGAEALHRAGRIDDACAVRQEHQRRFASP
jgi:tetratricopeptide (TPR) repeat protein